MIECTGLGSLRGSYKGSTDCTAVVTLLLFGVSRCTHHRGSYTRMQTLDFKFQGSIVLSQSNALHVSDLITVPIYAQGARKITDSYSISSTDRRCSHSCDLTRSLIYNLTLCRTPPALQDMFITRASAVHPPPPLPLPHRICYPSLCSTPPPPPFPCT